EPAVDRAGLLRAALVGFRGRRQDVVAHDFAEHLHLPAKCGLVKLCDSLRIVVRHLEVNHRIHVRLLFLNSTHRTFYESDGGVVRVASVASVQTVLAASRMASQRPLIASLMGRISMATPNGRAGCFEKDAMASFKSLSARTI